MKVLITGAFGRMGRMLQPRLAQPGRVLRLLAHSSGGDEPGTEGTEVITGSVTDLAGLTAASAGMDAVVHLAGLAQEAPWEEILHVNVHGTRCVLEAAHQAGVGRVILASSNHAAGYLPLADVPPGDCRQLRRRVQTPTTAGPRSPSSR